MITVWKQPLDIVDEQSLSIPSGAELLTVQVQHGKPQLWFKCDSNSRKIYRRIRIYGTGNPVNAGDDEKYLATFQIEGGQLVFHVFYS